jgi:hypothetical protein
LAAPTQIPNDRGKKVKKRQDIDLTARLAAEAGKKTDIATVLYIVILTGLI